MQPEEELNTKDDILIIDDTPDNLRLLNQILSLEYKVRLAPNGRVGLMAAFTAPPRLVLLDIMMPDMNGFEVTEKLKADPRTNQIPILLISALDDSESIVRGFKAGAVDYITKPFQEMEVLARVRTHLSIQALYRQAQDEIWARIQTEERLRQSEERSRALLSAVPDMIYRVGANGKILDFHASTPRLLFADPERLDGANLSEILNKQTAESLILLIKEAIATRNVQSTEFKFQAGSAPGSALYTFEARIKDSGPDEAIMMVRDISERKHLEEMKTDFINRATHELRTPLTTILLMVHLIDSSPSPEEFGEYWGVLKTEIDRERILVENLLHVGRLENNRQDMNFQPVDLRSLLGRVVEQMEPLALDKNLRLTQSFSTELGETGFVIQADEPALTQVFVNLLANAVKFSLAGGEISFAVQARDCGLEVVVEDHGIGIPVNEIPLLFNRFFRASNAVEKEYPGSGIGLYIVHSIVERHNGRIDVQSEAGKFTRFVVWLPG